MFMQGSVTDGRIRQLDDSIGGRCIVSRQPQDRDQMGKVRKDQFHPNLGWTPPVLALTGYGSDEFSIERAEMTILSKEQLEAELAHKAPLWWSHIQHYKGMENYYSCQTCKRGVVTIDRDAGATPASIKCHASEDCSGVMHSKFYPDPALKPATLGGPTYEWYRPDEVDDDDESEEAYHVMDGGLLLRKVVDDGADQAQSG